MADEYIKKQDAIDACYDGYADCRDDCAANIKDIPAADVRPVVRCKNCAWWEKLNLYDGHGAEPRKRTCGYFLQSTDGEDFCSYGADMREVQDG